MLNRCFLTGKGDRRIRQFRFVRRRLWVRSVCLLLAMVLTFTLCIQINAEEKQRPIAQEWQIRGIEAALGDNRVGVKKLAMNQLATYESKNLKPLIQKDTIQKIVDLLRDDKQDSAVRGYAAKALSNLGDVATPYIDDIFNFIKDNKQDSYARRDAAMTLGNLGNAATPNILAFLKNTKQDPIVSEGVYTSLGNLGDAATPYVGDILAILKNDRLDSYARGSAAQALGNCGSAVTPYINDFITILKDNRQNLDVRRAVAKALYQFNVKLHKSLRAGISDS